MTLRKKLIFLFCQPTHKQITDSNLQLITLRLIEHWQVKFY
jgi:hypothetical protein